MSSSPSAEKLPSVGKLSAETGFSEVTLYKYFKRGCPRDCAKKIKVWHSENIIPRQGAMSRTDPIAALERSQLNEALIRAQISKTRAEADAKELKLSKDRGEVMNTDQAMQAVRSMIAVVKIRFEDIPLRLQMEFSPEQRDYLTERVADEIRLALVEMSQQRLEEPEVEESDDDEE